MFCTEQRTALVACMCTGEPWVAIVNLEAKSRNCQASELYVLLFSNLLIIPIRQKSFEYV